MKLQDANFQAEFASEGQDKSHLEQAAKTATTAYEKAKAEMALVTEQVFQLYSMLIAEKARQPWTNIMQEQVEAERAVFYSRVKALEDSGYNLPSLSGKAGTNAYYDAFDKLSTLDAENYSTTEANFIVENAFYNDKQNFQQLTQIR